MWVILLIISNISVYWNNKIIEFHVFGKTRINLIYKRFIFFAPTQPNIKSLKNIKTTKKDTPIHSIYKY